MSVPFYLKMAANKSEDLLAKRKAAYFCQLSAICSLSFVFLLPRCVECEASAEENFKNYCHMQGALSVSS
jgi:hypothetical protein